MDDIKKQDGMDWSLKDFNYPVPEHAKMFGYTLNEPK